MLQAIGIVVEVLQAEVQMEPGRLDLIADDEEGLFVALLLGDPFAVQSGNNSLNLALSGAKCVLHR